jgi:hypothetical protein
MSEVVGLPNNTYKPIAPSFVNFKKGALDTQLQIIKFTSCLPMVGGSLRLPPPIRLVIEMCSILKAA